jgi:predicted nucleic acid-binding protein
MKALIDTNVILDALLAREPWRGAAQAVMLAVAREEIEGAVTASSFTDLYYLIGRNLHDEKKTRQVLLDLLASVSVLDVNDADCEKAFGLAMPDYEDALLACCGKRHKADLIVTRNIKHFENSPVKAVLADELLAML